MYNSRYKMYKQSNEAEQKLAKRPLSAANENFFLFCVIVSKVNDENSPSEYKRHTGMKTIWFCEACDLRIKIVQKRHMTNVQMYIDTKTRNINIIRTLPKNTSLMNQFFCN